MNCQPIFRPRDRSRHLICTRVARPRSPISSSALFPDDLCQRLSNPQYSYWPELISQNRLAHAGADLCAEWHQFL
jgi:hypothetical protein